MTAPTGLAAARARDPTGRPAVDDDLRTLGGHDVVLHREADQPLPLLPRGEMLDRELADEVVLVELRQPVHVRGEEVRLGVRVLADDDVSLLEAKHALRLEPERARAGGDDRVPEELARRAREMELVAELPDEADAEREARNARDDEVLRVEVAEVVRPHFVLGHALERVARARAGEVERRERARHVHDLGVVAPHRVPPLEPRGHGVCARGGGRDVEEVVGEPRDRAVVHDPAAVRGEDAVADPAGAQVREAVRVQALEQPRGLRALDEDLPEGGHVDHAERLVNRAHLVLRPLAVCPRALPGPGPHHPGACFLVAEVNRAASRRLVVRARRAGRAPPASTAGERSSCPPPSR